MIHNNVIRSLLLLTSFKRVKQQKTRWLEIIISSSPKKIYREMEMCESYATEIITKTPII